MKTKPCTICTHPRRVEIEKEALTQKSYADKTRAIHRLNPSFAKIDYQVVKRHFQKCQLSVAATTFLQHQYSNLEALNDIIARGVGKTKVKASDVVAAVKVKAEMESEKDRMRLFERFVMAFAADPEGALKNPEFKGVLPVDVKLGKLEKIPDELSTGTTKGVNREDLPRKE